MTVSLLDCQPQADYATPPLPFPISVCFWYASLCAGEASLWVAGRDEGRNQQGGAYLQILIGVSRELGAVHI